MILAILQARMGSTRLPGKVLKPLLGVPMMLRQIERLRRARLIDRLIVATSTEPADDAIESLCRGNDVPSFRGSHEDVLDRFYQAALTAQRPDHIVRFTADCPLIDPAIIDEVIDAYQWAQSTGCQYTSNTIPHTLPDGLDVEVFRFSMLERAWREAQMPFEREHVTPFMRTHGNVAAWRSSPDLSHHRWTVDTAKDFEFVEGVYKALYPTNPEFTWRDVLAWEGDLALQTV